MSSPEQLQESFDTAGTQTLEYRCQVNLNLYDSPICTRLATQAAVGRHLQILSRTPGDDAVEVRLCEDGYSGWFWAKDITGIEPAETTYEAIALSRLEIQNRLPQVIAFTLKAMKQPNYYLWGGTVGPNYDCSGLMQAAFAASGIWLPRDSYQQAAFTQLIRPEELLPGDLIFFGTPEKVDHVGLCIGDGYYVHSSGREIGRNGMGIDQLSEQGDEISRAYCRRLHSCGRVVENYQPSRFFNG